MKVKHLVGAFLCVLGCYACSSPKTEVQSPDGHIKKIQPWALRRLTASFWQKVFR